MRYWKSLLAASMSVVILCPALMARSRNSIEHEPRKMVVKVADAVLRDFPTPPDFNWGEGVLLAGMMRAYKLTEDERYLKFVRDFADHWYARGIGPTLEKWGYCGHWGPGFAMLLLYEQTGHFSWQGARMPRWIYLFGK